MKLIVILNRPWSIKLFLRLLPHVQRMGVSIPTYVVALEPTDERVLRVLRPHDISGYITFPIAAGAISSDEVGLSK